MELSDRKKAILRAIIQTYLETGEPVGSRTISKCSDLNLSSATIRNEMADLEEMGLIVQPHTSAGRIPSDRGYRLYVDDMMAEKEKEVSDMKEMLIQRVDRVELLLKQLAQLLATNTNYTAMIAGPRSSHNKVKYLQLSRVEADKLLAVVVVEGNIVKNTILDIEESLSDDALLQLNVLLNTSLAGKSLDDINLNLISEMKAQAGEYSEIVAVTLEAVADAIRSEEDSMIYTSGVTNVFRYPELADGENVSGLVRAFEEKKGLAELMTETREESNNTGIQVYIGSETGVSDMKDCSMVTASYELGDGLSSTIGIIGPKRMDYEKVVGTLKTMMEQLDQIYKK
ncbi:MAG: heat-inducible transcriptional repressor HrcA [Lachnospiraceae bacterium]|nr:heat-inducible transcriptional repressor HrcA [Lachnospiraceae bacterium]